jgi:hypothetical protein
LILINGKLINLFYLITLRNVIDNVEGVQTVKKLEIVNKVGTNENYSEYAYDIKAATINEVLYPSLRSIHI